jgi:uncharacterized protein YpmS
MKKWLKRIAIVAAVLLLGITILAAIGWRQAHRTPDFYKLYTWNSDTRAAVNQRAVEKITLAENLLAKAAAAETRAHKQGTKPASAPESMTLTFTEEELNAFLLHNFGNAYEPYMTNPGIFLRNGQVLLAANMKEAGLVVSFCFEPKLDETGHFRLRLTKCLAGRLPLPKALLNTYLDRVRAGLTRRLPAWQQAAKIDRSGAANTSAVSAAMSKLLLNALADKPADPTLFLPREGGVSLPLHLKELRINNESISFTLESLTAADRQQALLRIREPIGQ